MPYTFGVSTEPKPDRAADIKRYRSNLKEEVDGAALYRLLAEAEKNPHLRTVYERLAVSEDRHLDLWARKLREAGAEVPAFKPSFRVKVIGWLARRLGTAAVSPIVTRMEVADLAAPGVRQSGRVERLTGSAKRRRVADGCLRRFRWDVLTGFDPHRFDDVHRRFEQSSEWDTGEDLMATTRTSPSTSRMTKRDCWSPTWTNSPPSPIGSAHRSNQGRAHSV